MTITFTKPQARAEAATDGRETLSYAVGKSTLGSVLMAFSAKGVAAILIGDDIPVLVAELRASFPDVALLRTVIALAPAGPPSSSIRRAASICRSTSAARRFSRRSGLRFGPSRPARRR